MNIISYILSNNIFKYTFNCDDEIELRELLFRINKEIRGNVVNQNTEPFSISGYSYDKIDKIFICNVFYERSRYIYYTVIPNDIVESDDPIYEAKLFYVINDYNRRLANYGASKYQHEIAKIELNKAQEKLDPIRSLKLSV